MNTIDLKQFIEKLTAFAKDSKPTTATVMQINGNLADIQIGTSPTYLRNIEIYGNQDTLATGDEVAIIWTEKAGSFGLVPVIQALGNIVITSSGGKPLATKEPDPFSRAGWRVTSDGMIYKDDTYIHPDGQISLGTEDDVAIMSSAHATHRLWAGDIQPASAPFSVTKAGAIKATSGQIANWNIETNQLYADNYAAILNASTYPYIGLGGATGYADEGIWLGKDTDDIYKMYVGDPSGNHMYWDGTTLFITGTFTGSTDMSGTSSTSWTINEDDENTDITLMFKHPMADGTIIYDGSKFAFNKSIQIGGDTTFEDILPALNDTYDIGSSTLRWRKGYLSEMEAVLFIEDTVSAIGGWFMIPHGQGTLNEEVDNSETQIDFGANSIAVDDFILLRGIGAVEYLKAVSLVSGTVWNVTRDVDGTGANAWPEGHVYVVLGNTGDGRIELNAQTDAPQIGIIEQGSAYNQQTERVRIGNLNNWQGAGLSGYGWAAGNFSANEYACYSPTAGMVVRGTIKADQGYLADLDVSGALSMGPTGVLRSVSSGILTTDSGYYWEYNDGYPRFRIGRAIDAVDVVLNGTFDDNSEWYWGNDGWSWDDIAYKAKCDGTQTAYSYLYQSYILNPGDICKITYTLSNCTAGAVAVRCGWQLGTSRTTDGTYEEELTAFQLNHIYFEASPDFVGKIDDVSCEILTPTATLNGGFSHDDTWVKGDPAWTITDGKAVCSGAQSGYAYLYQANIISTYTSYKITYTVSNRTTGSIKVRCGWTSGTSRVTNDTFEETLTSDQLTSVYFEANPDFDGSIDNVMVYRTDELDNDSYPRLVKGIYWDGSNLAIESTNTTLDKYGNLTVKNITAISGELQNLNIAGGLNVASLGSIRGGATGYGVGNGFWLGDVAGTYKFFIGNATGNKILFDGTDLTVVGDGSGIINLDGVEIQDGTIDALAIKADAIRATHIKASEITGDKIALNTYLAIGSNTWQAQGIQLQYNSGTPRMYVGDGSYAYLKFDGSTLSASNMKLRTATLTNDAYGYVRGTGVKLSNTLLSIDAPGWIQWPRTPDGSTYASVGTLKFVSDAPIPIGELKATDLPMTTRTGSRLKFTADTTVGGDTYIELGSEGTGGTDDKGYVKIVVGGVVVLNVNYDETIDTS